MSRFVLGCCVILACVMAVFGADFWESKPYTKWSQAEATRMLSDSPWAKTINLRVAADMVRGSRGGAQREAQEAPNIQYVVSIRSAYPVRQANVRMQAIAKKYDKMDASAKQEFDAKWNQYLETKFGEVIVVAIDYRANDPSTDRRLQDYFQAATVESLGPSTLLTLADGKKVQPVEVADSGHMVQLAFPRPANLDPGSSFTIEFQHPEMPNQRTQRITTKFSLKEMVFNGASAY